MAFYKNCISFYADGKNKLFLMFCIIMISITKTFLKNFSYNKNMEEENKQNSEDEEEKNEVMIDNNPDNRMKKIKENVMKNPWMVSTTILAIIAVVLLIMAFRGGVTGNVVKLDTIVSEDIAGERLLAFANAQGAQAELVEINDNGIFYEVVISVQGQDLPVYVTKDGKSFATTLVPLTGGDVVQQQDTPIQQQQQPQNIQKSDKPQVELFVMTHCPYGTQAEKGMLPVYELLGDKINGEIKFIHYFMHDPEKTETPVQVCIREEQASKYNDYLKCFLEDGDTERCLKETKIDETKLNKCIEDKADEYYNADSALSEGYGVRGSPTLVVNGVIAQSGRDAASYLKTICSAFNEAPEECNEELSSASPSPGFGYQVTSGGSTQAQC